MNTRGWSTLPVDYTVAVIAGGAKWSCLVVYTSFPCSPTSGGGADARAGTVLDLAWVVPEPSSKDGVTCIPVHCLESPPSAKSSPQLSPLFPHHLPGLHS